ncbi:MAG: hypothetical protein WCG07_00995 [Candidatus Taylorbacteria bacterium]
MNIQHHKHILTSPIYIIASVLIGILIFGAGVFVGYHKARFSNTWDTNYTRGVGMMNRSPSLFAPFLNDADDVNPHGTIGTIVSIKLPLIMVKGQSEAEKVIVVGSSTRIRVMHTIGSTDDLKVGEFITSIGNPNDQGQIEASFIRIMPISSSTVPEISSTTITQ